MIYSFIKQTAWFITMTSLILLTACQEEIISPVASSETPMEESITEVRAQTDFFKEITIFDSLQKNHVVLRISSPDTLPVDVDFSEIFELRPIFSIPEEQKFSDGESLINSTDARQEEDQIINIDIVSQQLPEGAVGMRLDYKKANNSLNQQGNPSGYRYVMIFTTYYDNIEVTCWAGNITVDYWWKYPDGLWYFLINYTHYGYSYSFAGMPWSEKMRAYVGSNWTFNFSVFFY